MREFVARFVADAKGAVMAMVAARSVPIEEDVSAFTSVSRVALGYAHRAVEIVADAVGGLRGSRVRWPVLLQGVIYEIVHPAAVTSDTSKDR